MKSFARKLTVILTALVITLGLLASLHETNAQTRKKSTRKRTRTTPVPTPVPSQPTIISEAEQYQNQNQQIITGETPVQTVDPNQLTTDPNQSSTVEAQPETFEEKLDRISRRLDELSSRGNTEAGKKNDYDARQKRLALNLDILAKAEQRSESLRKQLFELVERENGIKAKLETLAFDLRPEIIERQVAFAGTTRPEELREMRRKTLDAEKRSLETLLSDIQTRRLTLEASVQRAEQLVEKLRAKLEKDIDDALVDEPRQ